MNLWKSGKNKDWKEKQNEFKKERRTRKTK